MPILNWDQTLDISVKAINKDHRDILDAMNKVLDSHEAGETRDVINQLIARPGKVCIRYFTDEEKFMEKTNYPGLKTHKVIHRQLLKKSS